MSAPLRIAPVKKPVEEQGSLKEIIEDLPGAGRVVQRTDLGGRHDSGDLHMQLDAGAAKKITATPVKKKQAGQTQPEPIKDYLERLIKLIPAEVVSLYLVGIGVIPKDAIISMWVVGSLV